MKSICKKKYERLEKKKRKLLALAEVMKLNDQDNFPNSESSRLIEPSGAEANADVNKMLPIDPKISPGPRKKKVRVESFQKEKKIEKIANVSAGDENLQISDEQLNEIKRSIKKRKHVPQFRLKEFGELASLTVDHDRRTPIFLTDIQHLLMGAIIGAESAFAPTRWCTIEKLGKLSHSVIMIIEGLSLFHYLSYENLFEDTKKIFNTKLEVILPSFERGRILKTIATVPLTAAQKDQLIEKYGTIESAIELNKDPTFLVKEVFPIVTNDIEGETTGGGKQEDDKFPRTKLLLSALQMVDEGYPMPLRGELARKYSHFKFTKEKYAEVTPKSPMFGVDCEMCKTSAHVLELTRISIVDENYETVYETLVRPNNEIIDYLTQFSGITPEMMYSCTKRLPEVQKEVSELLPCDAILVGQSLNVDLHAMQMMHPYVIDTSVIFNLSGDRKKKSKLKLLTKELLGENIQGRIFGHDSVEDSLASLKLTKLKLSKSIDFGDVLLMRKKEQNKAKQLEMTNNFFACVSNMEKTASIVSVHEIPEEIKNEIDGNYKINIGDTEQHSMHEKVQYHKVDGNKSAINKTKEIILDNALTICNISLEEEQVMPSEIEKSIERVVKWIRKVYESVSINGLFIVIMGNSTESTSGVAMLKIKKAQAAHTI